MITIESMRVGVPPEDFDFGLTGQGGPGQWTVVADTTSTGGRAIEQSSTERTDYRFPLAIHRPFSARNVDVSWSLLNAAIFIAIVPTLILVVLVWRYVVEGLIGGAVKG